MPVERTVMAKENFTQSKIRRIKPRQTKNNDVLSNIVIKILAAIGVFVLVFLCLIVGIIVSPNYTTDANGNYVVDDNDADKYKIGHIGSPVTASDLQFTVFEAFYITKELGYDIEPYKVIAFDVEIINKSTKSQSIYINTWMVKDEFGRQYGQDYLASSAMERGTIGGELMSHDTMRGIVAFKVLPSRTYQLVFSDLSKEMVAWGVKAK